MLSTLQNKGVYLSGDGRCDSPGHNAKYLTYSLYDQTTNRVIGFSLTQVSEVENSNRMEKQGLMKVLADIKRKNIDIKQLTTDRHVQIKKYMREQEEDIDHKFDVCHFSKRHQHLNFYSQLCLIKLYLKT